jgi:HNH endonuclease
MEQGMASRYKTLCFPKGDHPLFPGKKWVGKHRVVMAEKLGRPLLSTEIVHHRDGDGFNNKRRNLKLIQWGEHSRLHNKGLPQSITTRRKRSKTLRGRKFTPEHIANMRLVRLGKHLSEATKLKLSLANEGRVRTKATRKRMRDSWTLERRAAFSKFRLEKEKQKRMQHG